MTAVATAVARGSGAVRSSAGIGAGEAEGLEWDARMDEEEAIETMMESEGAVAQAQGAEEDAERCSSGGGGVGGRDSGGGGDVDNGRAAQLARLAVRRFSRALRIQCHALLTTGTQAAKRTRANTPLLVQN